MFIHEFAFIAVLILRKGPPVLGANSFITIKGTRDKLINQVICELFVRKIIKF